MSNSHALTSRQWQQLSNIRQLFLEGDGIADYWRNQEILEAYHRTFACDTSDLSPSRRLCQRNRRIEKFCLGASIATGSET